MCIYHTGIYIGYMYRSYVKIMYIDIISCSKSGIHGTTGTALYSTRYIIYECLKFHRNQTRSYLSKPCGGWGGWGGGASTTTLLPSMYYYSIAVVVVHTAAVESSVGCVSHRQRPRRQRCPTNFYIPTIFGKSKQQRERA